MIKGDWVTSLKGDPSGVGQIQRVSLTKGWADVQWSDPKTGNWTKRMKLIELKLITIIDINPTEKAALKTSQC